MKKIFFMAFMVLATISCKKDDGGNNNCGEPNSINISVLGSTSVLFDWGSGGETAWEIEYGLSGFTLGTGTVIQTSQQNYLVNGLTPGTNYEIYLRANCGSNGFSNHIRIEFVTDQGNANCNTPSNLDLGFVSSNFVQISWFENNETAWEVEFGPVNFTLGTGTVIQTSQSFFEIMGLTPSTTYEVYVRANCGSGGFSDYEGPLVFTTTP